MPSHLGPTQPSTGPNPGALNGAGDFVNQIMDFIGGPGGGGGNTFVNPDQRPFLQDIYNRASDLSNQPGTLPFDPLQIEGQVDATAYASRLPGLTDKAQSANEFLLGDVLNPDSNPYLRDFANQAISPIFENLNNNVLPGIRGSAAQVGGVGSSRQGIAEGLASSGALGSAGDVSTGIFSRAYGQGLNALVQGLQLAPQTAQLGLLPSQIKRQIGGERRDLQTSLLNDPFSQVERFNNIIGKPTLLSTQDPSAGTGIAGLLDNPTVKGLIEDAQNGGISDEDIVAFLLTGGTSALIQGIDNLVTGGAVGDGLSSINQNRRDPGGFRTGLGIMTGGLSEIFN